MYSKSNNLALKNALKRVAKHVTFKIDKAS